MYEQVAIITHIWHRDKYYFTSMSNTWYLITVPNMNNITTFFPKISQQRVKSYEKITIMTQIWHRVKFYFTCISGPWYLIMVPQYEENPSSNHGGMCEDNIQDRRTDGLDPFVYSPITCRWSGEQ